MILTTVPRLVWKAVIARNFPLLALTLDLAIPPLSLLVILLVGTLFIAVLAMFLGASPAPFTITVVTFAALIVAILSAWVRFGRDILPIGSVFSVVSYVLAKFPIYYRALSLNVTSQWTRTDRKKSQ